MRSEASKGWRLALLSSSVLLPALFASAALAQAADGAATETSEASAIEEVVVTATRQAQSLSRVPVSVSAYTQQRMDSQGVRNVTDVVRLTPGITLTPGRIRTQIAIRGISSNAGSATTGIYIEDTPIQVRTIGVSSQNVYPFIFDLERVEVLRGPQGTLFGAGSEGGTVRFIQPAPSLTRYSGYARAEIGSTAGGATSYEGGVAAGGPIIEDKLGFRASVYHRRDGGWVDKVIGTATVVDPTGRQGAGSVKFTPTGVFNENTNWGTVTAMRFALGWAPTSKLMITPSVFLQRQYDHDHFYNYWPQISDPKSNDFKVPVWIPAGEDAIHNYVPRDGVNGLPGAVTNEPFEDKFALPSLNVNWDAGFANVVSNTSYFLRSQEQISDYTMTHVNTYPRLQVPRAGDAGWSLNANRQEGFTQELRFQSKDPDARLTWVAGGFYTKQRQWNLQISYNNVVQKSPSVAVAAVPGFPTPPPAVSNGAPFGPGYSGFINFYGIEQIYGIYQYYVKLITHDEQIAGFLQTDYKLTDKLKVTGGIRYSKNDNDIVPFYRGPITNLNTPQGRACVPGTGIQGGAPCVAVPVGAYKPGEGPFAPAFVEGKVSGSDKAWTPKLMLSYQADERNMFYASATKGYRPGGAQQRQPSNCNAQLISLGYTDANGLAAPPPTYDADSLWSYELGSKNRLFGGRVQIDASAYYIDWKNIISTVSLSSCLQSMFDNLGGAEGKGFDLQIQTEPFRNFVLSTAIGYNKTSFKDDVVLGGRRNFTKGSAIPGSGAPLTVTLSGQYDFSLPAELGGYVRSDITYSSAYRRTGNSDPGTVSFDALVPPQDAYTQVNARFGVKTGLADISLFINNLTNTHPSTGFGRTAGQPLFTDWTIRPRTIGVTASLRY